MQVSDHAANLRYTAPASVQFPSLIGLPMQCLLLISAGSHIGRMVGRIWMDYEERKNRKLAGQRILTCIFVLALKV